MCAQSADEQGAGHADFLFEDLVQAYMDCRRTKRNSKSALDFESNLEKNLIGLCDDLVSGNYQPGKSICFVITHPKPREVWAAPFRDRVVHHLLYNKIAPRFYARFIADSCACIPGRGTLYAAKRLESKIRSITQNWSKPAFYLKMDVANFFVAIKKSVISEQLKIHIPEPWWFELADKTLMHDPRENYEMRCDVKLIELVPPHKRLTNQSSEYGLPIGNLSSQFFANIYLDALDQFVKHELRAKYYIRYVDDFIILHESPQQLNEWLAKIDAFLPAKLGVILNPKKTILQSIDRGVDFVGHVIKPWRRTTRRRVINHAIRRIETMDADKVFETANSYFGLATQASHSFRDRTKLVKAVFGRGYSVNMAFTKTLN